MKLIKSHLILVIFLITSFTAKADEGMWLLSLLNGYTIEDMQAEGFKLTVREIEIAAGAGFVIPITGNMLRMPGLPMIPAAEGIDIDAEGNISGLS